MSNSYPFFSVITCTKNSEKYIAQCLRSLGDQEYQNYEHIIVDGGSTDKTLSYIPKNSRVYVQKSRGISGAMNEGIQHARGKYVYFLHSDDYFYDKNVLCDLYAYLSADPEVDWVYGQINTIESSGESIGYFPTQKVFQIGWKYLLKFVNYIPHQAVFIKRSIYRKYGYFSTNLAANMDYDYWLRICAGTKWKYVDRVVANYRIHTAATSSSRSKYSQNQKELGSIQDRYLSSGLERKLSRSLNHLIGIYNKAIR